ncbi:SGNH/GDSL hydrolase family protein [Nocardia higoensis]|uniref:SGNH/GDSL hydrolase family protein n=1 Tax=Nocardia higoensis TaxID=228599 RepID=UPI0002D33766|nr:SGNH/GDSL hydrolase family protein [Nocardia higoensis]
MACAGTAQAAPQPGSAMIYVAMGDSFSSGLGIAPQAHPGAFEVCSRSTVNYPTLVAAALGAAEVRDVTCAGAGTADLSGPQLDLDGSLIAPQYDALTPDTTLVTVGIGGNDVGMFPLFVTCTNWLPEPFGLSCAQTSTAGGRDTMGERIEAFAPAYGAMIDEIRRRAPQARILLVGYPLGIRQDGCPGTQPVWPADANYERAKIDQLNSVMQQQAAAHQATYLDLGASADGHDVCAPVGERWIEGTIPSSPAATAPGHPNAAYHDNAARRILTVISHKTP